MQSFSHYPGTSGFRQFTLSGYNRLEESLWRSYADMYYSYIYNYSNTRMPRPNYSIDYTKFLAWKEKFFTVHKSESQRDINFTSSFDPNNISESLLLYLYQRMLCDKDTQSQYI